LMGGFLYWANGQWNWIEMREQALWRLLAMGLVLLTGGGIYLGALWALGFRLKTLLTPKNLNT